MAAKDDANAFVWDDPLLLDEHLTEEERMVRGTAAAYARDRLLPRVIEAFRNEHTDPAIFREMGELGLLGVTIPEQHGGIGAGYVTYGLIAREIERVDSGYRSMMSVQSVAGHVSDPRLRLGGAEGQVFAAARHRRADRLHLTEPGAGSDPGGMKTRATKTDGATG